MNQKKQIDLVVKDPLNYALSLLNENPGYEGICYVKTFFMFQPDEVLAAVFHSTDSYIIRELALFKIKDDRVRTDLALEAENDNLRFAGLYNCKDPAQIQRYLLDKNPMVCRRAEEILARELSRENKPCGSSLT